MLAKLDPGSVVLRELVRRLPRSARELLALNTRLRNWLSILGSGDTAGTRIYLQEAAGSVSAALALVQPAAAAALEAAGLAPFLPDELRLAEGLAAAARGQRPDAFVASHYAGTAENAVVRATQHAALHGGKGGKGGKRGKGGKGGSGGKGGIAGGMGQLTDRLRQKLAVLDFELLVLHFFSHADIAAVAAETGVPPREVGRIAEAIAEHLTDADANVAATGTNEGQAYKRIAAIISSLARELVREATAAQQALTLEEAVVLVKGTMPAEDAVESDVHLISYWEAGQREAGLSAKAPIGALQSVMCAATGASGGESKRDSHAARHHLSAPLLATPRPRSPTHTAPAPSPALRRCAPALSLARRSLSSSLQARSRATPRARPPAPRPRSWPSPAPARPLEVRASAPTRAPPRTSSARPSPGEPSGFRVVAGRAERVRSMPCNCVAHRFALPF